MYDKNLSTDTIKCNNCGANLKFVPGDEHLKCDYCGTVNDIQVSDIEIEEYDFHKFLENKEDYNMTITEQFIKCNNCGATLTFNSHETSGKCAYCTEPLIIESAHDEKTIKPESLLPFKLNKKEALEALNKWIKKLFLAPNKLKKMVLDLEYFKGIYIPYWSYDTDTHTNYTGRRGEYYYVTETYTTTENGKTVTKTRQVQKTRWYPASGNVNAFFDDILIPASLSISEEYAYKLEPWDLENLVPYSKEYLSGFVSERYQLELEEGFAKAQNIMKDDIREAIHRDIGGDTQQIISMNPVFDKVKFKHLLLPVYHSAFKFNDKLYQFLVNARTGEVQGERPYSKIKIAMLALLGIIIIGAIIYFTR
ncbi:MAG: hypothetical protein WCT23_08325 [Candidatus Neomarinimicrobiota bacterium]